MAEDAVGYGKPPKEHQWGPGQSGNPAGYPTGVPNRSTLLKRLLALEYEIDDPLNEGKRLKVSVEEAVQWGVIQKAVSGDVPAYKEIMDSVYGKLTDKVEVSAPKKTIIKIGGKKPSPDADSGSGDNGD